MFAFQSRKVRKLEKSQDKGHNIEGHCELRWQRKIQVKECRILHWGHKIGWRIKRNNI